ncbi:hypothetical protein G9A89_001933 [Geosiphon pyriformis]|nr:hypothetical protein G9A89_001933 [Geosiphon pyriformis]
MSDYNPGTVVYAKLKGYPWWPARVEVESSLPKSVLSRKPKLPRPIWGVRFFGSKDYGWFGSSDLKLFDKMEAEERLDKPKGKKRDKTLEKAIREALDPTSLDEPIQSDREDSDSDQELEIASKKSSDSHENHDKSVSQKSNSRTKASRKNEKNPSKQEKSSVRRKSASAKSKKNSYSNASDNDQGDLGSTRGDKSKKRRVNERSVVEKFSKRKQRKIDYTDEDEDPMDADAHIQDDITEMKEEEVESPPKESGSRSEGSGTPSKSEMGSVTGDGDDERHTEGQNDEERLPRHNESLKKSKTRKPDYPPVDKLLYLRHKLQKLTLKEQIDKQDMVKIDSLFKEVEEFKITIELLKGSKIGKLMKKIFALDIEQDHFSIKNRAGELIKKWKILLATGVPEATSPKTSQIEELPRSGQELPEIRHVSEEHMEEIIKHEGPEDRSIVKIKHEEPKERPAVNEPENMDIKSEDKQHVASIATVLEALSSPMDTDPVEVRPTTDNDRPAEEVVTNGSSAENNGTDEEIHNEIGTSEVRPPSPQP